MEESSTSPIQDIKQIDFQALQEKYGFSPKKFPSKQIILNLQKQLHISSNTIDHQIMVMRKARQLAHNITKTPVNIEIVKLGALVHDIGRCQTHGMLHASIGGDILRLLGFSEEVARIAERHSMAGFTSEEADIFHLPTTTTYMPETIEEKIVCLADKYHSGSKKVTIEQRFQRWIDRFGASPFLQQQLKRAKQLEEEVLSLIF